MTHAISRSQNFNVLSLSGRPLFRVPFPVESGCKDTTFFQTCKFFFDVFFFTSRKSDGTQTVGAEKKFYPTAILRPKNTAK